MLSLSFDVVGDGRAAGDHERKIIHVEISAPSVDFEAVQQGGIGRARFCAQGERESGLTNQPRGQFGVVTLLSVGVCKPDTFFPQFRLDSLLRLLNLENLDWLAATGEDRVRHGVASE